MSGDLEWGVLEKYLYTSIDDTSIDDTSLAGWVGTDIGGILKEAGTLYWTSPNTGANDSIGFSILPDNNRDQNGNYQEDSVIFFD